MPTLDFSKYETLSFDCYGTLIDWETGIRAELGAWGAQLGLNEDELLGSFGEVESQVQNETPKMPYSKVLAEVMRRIGQPRGVMVEKAEAEKFGGSVGRWPPFPDSIAALAELKKRFKLVILSNIDRASFAKSNRALGAEFDLIVTAEDVGSYKPDRQNFLALFDRLASIGADRSTLLHSPNPFSTITSLRWHSVSRRFGSTAVMTGADSERPRPRLATSNPRGHSPRWPRSPLNSPLAEAE